jgi:hypothetical protein
LSFARDDDANALDVMYEGCEDRAEEMRFRYVDLRMAEKIMMLRRTEEINEHARKLTKAKPPCPAQVILKRGALERLMAEENPEKVIEGKSSKRNFDVWLAIDRGISWQPSEGKKQLDYFEWGNMVLTFYFPKKAFLRKVKISACFLAFVKPQRANIVSWVRDWLGKNGYSMRKVGIPMHLAAAGSLVGAALDDMKHEELNKLYDNPREY